MRRRKESWLWPMTVLLACGVAYHVWVVRPVVRRSAAAEEAVRMSQPDVKLVREQTALLRQLGQELKHGRQEQETLNKESLDAARVNSLTSDLQTVRSQLELYKVQHRDSYPALENFAAQMTGTTNIAGQTGPDFGPYLQSIPTNPFSGGNKVGNGQPGSSDWYYSQETGEFRANHQPRDGEPVDRW